MIPRLQGADGAARGETVSMRWRRTFTLSRGVRKARSMASTSAKVLLASVACAAPLLLAGLHIGSGRLGSSTSTPIRQITLAAAADDTSGAAPQQLQPRVQSQPATTAP